MDVPVIPRELLPSDGRFGSGPSRVRDSQVQMLSALGRTVLGTSHRQAPVRDLVRRVRQGIGALLEAPDDYEVVLGNGGTSTFWDVATFSLVGDRPQHAVCGEFGAKFADGVRAAPFLPEPEIVRAEPGTSAAPVGRRGVDTYAFVQNETSTGVMTPALRPAGADADSLTLIDATSAVGGLPVDLTQCDAYYFAPQKALGSEGGLWIALLSPAAVERVSAQTRWTPASLSLRDALASSRKDETVNTPAIATLALLAAQLEWLLDDGGLPSAVARCEASAALLYQWAAQRPWARPFVADPASRSTVVATIDLDPAIDAARVRAVLRANGVVDVDPYRKLGRNQLRIGMFPSVPTSDVEALTRCVDHVVGELSLHR